MRSFKFLQSFSRMSMFHQVSKHFSMCGSSSGRSNKPPMRVAITGATGNIGYALAFRIASGELLGRDQPVILHLVDIPGMDDKLKGVLMELDDCAFPLLEQTVTTTDLKVGFNDIDVALLVGSKPRSKGMERGDLLNENGKIFVSQGRALNDHAKRTVKVLVVGNPANTNCLIAMKNAPNLPSENFNAMTRLDHNRGLAQLAQQVGSHPRFIRNFAIWGNHSSTMFPDLHNTTINGKRALDLVSQEWYNNEFIPIVQQRGAAIIKARGASSAASAGNSAIDHVRDWVLGSSEWVSMSVPTDGRAYGIEKDLIFSFPCTVTNGKYTIVPNLTLNEFSRQKIEETQKELVQERNLVEHLLK